MKKYQRATPIGIWTGKIMIGGHYIPKPKQMTENEYFIQGIVLGRGLPPEKHLSDIILKVKSVFRNLREQLNERR